MGAELQLYLIVNLITLEFSLEIKDLPAGKLVTLNKSFGTRSKYLFYAEGLVFLILGIIVVFRIIIEAKSGLNVLMFAAGAIVCFIAAFRFFRSALMKEELLISKNELQIVRAGLFDKTFRRLQVSKIKSFRFRPKPELTGHPLAGADNDQPGFPSQHKVTNDMHGDLQLVIDYDGEQVLFGKDIVSWQYENLPSWCIRSPAFNFAMMKKPMSPGKNNCLVALTAFNDFLHHF